MPAGYFAVGADSEGRGATDIDPCGPGLYKAAGAGACTTAPAGQVTTGGRADGYASTGIAACAAGTYKPTAGVGLCIPAPAGSHVPTTGATAAALCRPGTFSATTGASACTPAEVGFFVPGPGATSQRSCPTATEAGATSCPTAAPVRPAPATTEESSDDLPEASAPAGDGDPCPVGTWSVTGTVPRGGQCTPALPGAFVAEVGATAEEPCPAGSYSAEFGAAACEPAPVGTYVPVAGTADPLPCASATTEGATSCADAGGAGDEAVAIAAPISEVGADGGGLGFAGVLGAVVLALAVLVGFLHVQGVIAIPGLAGGPTTRVPRPSRASRRRPRPVDRSGRPAAPAPSAPAAASDVLEWSEYDPALDDGPPDPPPAPRG